MPKKYEYILTYGVTTETLTINPAGWNNIGVSFIRHEFYHSILRSLSLPLRFANITGGGFDFILNAYNTDGISANVIITINKRNPNTNAFDFYYSGNLDFQRMVIERDYIEIPTMDGMKMQKLISRDEIEIDLFKETSIDNIAITPFTNDHLITFTPIDIFLTTAGICETLNYGMLGYIVESDWNLCLPSGETLTRNELGDRVVFPDTAIVTIGGYRHIEYTPSGGSIWTNTTTELISLRVNYVGNYTIRIHLSDTGYDDQGCDINYSIVFYNASNVAIYTSYIILGKITKSQAGVYGWINNGSTTPTVTFISQGESDEDFSEVGDSFDDPLSYAQLTGSIDLSVYQEDLGVNFYAVISCEYTQTEHISALWKHNGTISEISFKEQSSGKENTTCPVLFPHEAFTRLIQATTSELTTSKLFYSEFFGRTDSEFTTYTTNGEGSKDATFTGFMVRNYPNAPLTVTLREYFKTFDSIYNLGFGYDRTNDRFYINPKEYFFDRSYFMFDLGEVKNLKITPFLEKYFSKIISGYENEGIYEEYQGAFEFNTQREYSDSQPVKNEKDIRSKYNTDSIGIELARRKQYIDNGSLDTRFDNNVYVVRTDGVNPVLDATVTGFEGIEAYYNTMLTPRQNMIRWGNVLMSALYKNTNPIKFQSTSKQISMSYDSTDELSDITQVELDNPLFIPELLSFESFITTNILTILNTNPHGFIVFSYEGNRYAGFINKVESGDYNKKATYELIRADIELIDLTFDTTIITFDSTEITWDQNIY